MITFKDFLKTSGIQDQNIAATLETVSFTNKNGKKFLFILDDVEKCLAALWVSSDLVAISLGRDWRYDESRFRQAFGAAFTNLGSNSVASNLGSQTPNTVRCLELYAYFLLQKAPTGKLDKPEILKGENLDGLFYGKDLTIDFQEWLKNTKQLADKSVTSYSGAVSGLLSECAGKNLLKISKQTVLEPLSQKILKHAEFIQRNNTGNQMYSAALNHYTEFWEHRSAGPLKKSFIDLCNFCKTYSAATEPWMTDDDNCKPAHKALQEIREWLEKSFGRYAGQKFTIEAARGAGHFPKVPWVCILPEGQKAADGVYVSICFGREGNGAVAGCAESVSSRRGLKVIKRSEKGPLSIDVDGASPGTKYNDSFENPLEFKPDDFDEQKFANHIADSLERCLFFLGLKTKEPFGPEHKKDFRAKIEAVGFNVLDALPENLITALAAKPFIILTGNSGTGKTKLAELFAQWLCGEEKNRLALIPVGADWTDNRNVLGFVNHIRPVKPAGETLDVPVYQSTGILDLLLSATAQPAKPFFLILDEMNLSHVERYFADFLSAIESRNGELPLHREGRALPRKDGGKADVPEILPLPRNVFVIGTVNVDETTYMFSPKVLDRANVIEFRVDKDAPKTFLASGGKPVEKIKAAPDTYATAFLELSYRARGIEDKDGNKPQPLALALDLSKSSKEDLEKEPLKSLQQCHKVVSELFALMQKSHQEFAFRSMSEILRFLAVDYELTADKPNWKGEPALDAQILQKILPKLHGSKRKLGPLLAALARYCEAGKKAEAEASFADQTAVETYPAEGEKLYKEPVYRDSHRKLCEMILTVRRDQFVSFIQ